MTLTRHTQKRTRRALLPNAAELVFGFCTLFCLLLLLRNAEAASAFMTRGLTVCAKAVIPSLFPFAVLSELIVSGQTIRRLLCRVLAPIRHLLGLSDDGACAVLLGMLCGFPIGTRCALHAYQRGSISRDEAERAIACSSCPSPAFLIGTVGSTLLANRRFGVMLYLCTMLSALLVGVLLRLRMRGRSTPTVHACAAIGAAHPSAAKRLTDAVGSATQSMLLVCAYVVFFSTVVGALGLILAPLDLPEPLSAILHAVFELSGGAERAASLSSVRASHLILAFAAGWSGLSVHCQTLSFCSGTDLSLRPYLLAKALQGGLTAAMIAILFR